MSVAELRTALAGVAVVLTTPFDRRAETLDEAGLRRNVRYLIESGIRLLVPCGGTGEYFHLTRAEARRVAEIVTEEAAGRARVLVGIGYDLATAVALGKHAAGCGADGVMVLPPIQTYTSPEGLFRYHASVAEALPIGVVPYIKQPGLTVDHLRRLFRMENVVGTKYAINDLNLFANTVKAVDNVDIVWACGTAERWAPFFWLAGARGFTSGIANFAPKAVLELLAALQAGDWGRAMALREQLTPFEELRARHGNAYNIPAVKAAMDLAGLTGGPVRPPLSPVAPEDESEVSRLARDLQAGSI